MKIISFFNHKGGVSKTTSTFHVGWKLAELGYKV
ncbi:ParA family protein, partial [Xanthomonas hortorum pv. gardneri]|nr:ParA family protein [Xanthomonas hortorum pv. gardneri]